VHRTPQVCAAVRTAVVVRARAGIRVGRIAACTASAPARAAAGRGTGGVAAAVGAKVGHELLAGVRGLRVGGRGGGGRRRDLLVLALDTGIGLGVADHLDVVQRLLVLRQREVVDVVVRIGVQALQQLLFDGVVETCGNQGLLFADGLSSFVLLVDTDQLGAAQWR
jgi:hypothetical protein